MATVKVNSRSPYYVVASGADGGTIENASVKIVQVTDTGDKDGPISEVYGNLSRCPFLSTSSFAHAWCRSPGASGSSLAPTH